MSPLCALRFTSFYASLYIHFIVLCDVCRLVELTICIVELTISIVELTMFIVELTIFGLECMVCNAAQSGA